jgi:uncharacterized membrane protein YjgN (DUF898 family)
MSYKNIDEYEQHLSNLSISGLQDIERNINKEQYSDRFDVVKKLIRKKDSECKDIYDSACRAYHDEKNFVKALKLFQTVTKNYPGTKYFSSAKQHIKKIPENTLSPGIQEESLKKMELAFHGSAKEYFNIWVVNLCLTLFSLGIFSAWAKVRKKRYFYSHLTLDSIPFQYLAKPLPILKGRIIAAILFLLYYFSSKIFTNLLPYVLGLCAIIAPWVLVQSAAFNARYSAYRNIKFNFAGTYIEALKVLLAWGLIPVIGIGTAFNWWGEYWIAFVAYLLFGILFPFWLKNLKKFVITKTSYGGKYGHLKVSGTEFWSVYFKSGLILLGFAVISILLSIFTIGIIKMPNYIITISPVYIGYIFAYAYIQANITNIVWSNIKLGPILFACSLKWFEMVKLYFTNALGIIFSAGLLIPWAVIRTYKYRIDNTKVYKTGALKEFQGTLGKTADATGAEIIDFFDMDLSL